MAKGAIADTSSPIPGCFWIADAMLDGACVPSLNLLTRAAHRAAGPRPCLPAVKTSGINLRNL